MAKKDNYKEVFSNIVSNKKVQWAFVLIVFLAILISSVSIRLSNLPLLKDQTDGQVILADLDALYFLRLSEVVLQQGNLNGEDDMRYPSMDVSYFKEIMPYVVVWMYKTAKIFNDEVTLRLVHATSPAFFYGLGLIIFFFLCYVLTKSKTVSVLASAFLAYSPAYLFRTMTGVSDHEAIGMIPFFATLLVFVLALKKFEKGWKNTFLYGFLLALMTALTFVSWGGVGNFLLMIIPFSVLIFYLFNLNDEDLKSKEKAGVFYFVWVVFSVLLMPLFQFSLDSMYGRFLGSSGILVFFVLVFILVDYLIEKYKFGFIKQKFRVLYSIIISIVLGLIGLTILGKNPLDLLNSIYIQILFPFGVGRVGLTVAENAQPYLTDLINQVTPIIFWFFVGGMIFVGVRVASEIKSLKHKILFVFSWTLAIFAILFSRISPSSIFNGTSVLSQLVYIIGFGLFLFYFAWLYFNDRFKISAENIIIFSWMLFMFIAARSAVRTLFVVATFVSFAAAYFIYESYKYARKVKDETLKYLLYSVFAISIILAAIVFFGNPIAKTPGIYAITSAQAQYIGPSANAQWQEAMAWTRNNTNEKDIFIHWWDYGYFVQTLGLRPTVTDGGHANSYWDHLIGRYLLTTPYPETAMSLMKSHNVSYLLIDPTELGKYGAYSKIGGDVNNDRYSAPNVVVNDPRQSMETANGTTKVYVGSTFVDEDISYNGTFLPGPTYDKYDLPTYRSYFVGAIMHVDADKNSSTIKLNQPLGIYVYNNKQYQLPIRYVYYDNEIIDFGTGINHKLMIIPQVEQTTNGQIKIDPVGAGIYLSERVQEGLFARLYLMNDAENQYPTLSKAHFEDDYIVSALKQQGVNLGEIIYFQGLRAPLKIWKVDYSDNALDLEEFRAMNGGFAELDNLKFTK